MKSEMKLHAVVEGNKMGWYEVLIEGCDEDVKTLISRIEDSTPVTHLSFWGYEKHRTLFINSVQMVPVYVITVSGDLVDPLTAFVVRERMRDLMI